MSAWVLWIVLAGHFVSAFSALGMPPFFPLILDETFGDTSGFLAGWLYSLPILMTAITAPLWGRLADRVGVRGMLFRAQIGLAASFLLAGYAQTLTQFVVALILQGTLGGTFAASNAYLARVLSGDALGRALTRTQASARAALVLAPVAFGAMVMWLPAIELYRYIAWLPLLAAIGTLRLPAAEQAVSGPGPTDTVPYRTLSLRQLYWLQGLFVFGTVVTFPYFMPFAIETLPGANTAIAGLLFGLPHLVYLASAGLMTRWIGATPPISMLTAALAILLVSVIGQAVSASGGSLTAWRLLMGGGMTLAYIALHRLIAAAVQRHAAGRGMGRVDSSAKWGGVGAGAAAALVFAPFGSTAPFMVAAVAIALAMSLTLYWGRVERARPRFQE